jgi:hypothetical protein
LSRCPFLLHFKGTGRAQRDRLSNDFIVPAAPVCVPDRGLSAVVGVPDTCRLVRRSYRIDLGVQRGYALTLPHVLR